MWRGRRRDGTARRRPPAALSGVRSTTGGARPVAALRRWAQLRHRPTRVRDLARRQGTRQRATRDSATMVAAREGLLPTGHDRSLSGAVGARAGGGLMRDAGAGTGYYLAAVLERTPGLGIAIDSSAYALRRAARAHPAIGAVRADLWRDLPLGDGVADVVLNVFAPRHAAEFARVLRRGGRLVTVTPEPRHLVELVSRLDLLSVDAEQERRLAESPGRRVTVARR